MALAMEAPGNTTNSPYTPPQHSRAPTVQYAVPGQPGISSTVPELANMIMHDSHAHGFDARFVQELCDTCAMHAAHAHAHCEWFLNLEVSPRTAVSERKMQALGRYVSACSGLWVQVHVLQPITSPADRVKVSLLLCQLPAVLLRQGTVCAAVIGMSLNCSI